MKRLGLIVLALSFLCTAALAADKDFQMSRNYDWANDPRSLATSTEGIEEFLPERPAPEPSNTAAFGDLLGQWAWSSLGMPAYYGGCGLAIDYPYLYVNNQAYYRVYQLDISSLPPSGARYMSPSWWPWGAGTDNEPDYWGGTVSPAYGGDGYNYEYDISGWPMSYTGNRFYNLIGSYWMADMSSSIPSDSICQIRVGSGATTNAVYWFAEPSGNVGRNIYHNDWGWVSQRGLAYNEDNHTFICGSWNTYELWEFAYTDGSPLPGRNMSGPATAGCAYQAKKHDGRGKLWVQENSYYDNLYLYDWPPVAADDISVEMIKYPNFPLIDPNPFAVVANIANKGTADQDFDTWCEITYDGEYWESDVISMSLASYANEDVEFDEFENGQDIGTEFDICVYVDNPGDEEESNNSLCTEAKVGRECWQYVGDDGVIRLGIAHYYNYYTWAKRMFQPGVTDPVAVVWLAVNTISKGEPFYPWPDPVYDPIRLQCYTDDNMDGQPDQRVQEPVWSEVKTPGDSPSWVIAEVPPCKFLGAGGYVWGGFGNVNNYPATREGLGWSYTAGDYECWYGYNQYWYQYSYYQGAHIRSCLEHPPLIAITGLGEIHWTPPKPPVYPENLATAPFHMAFCGKVDGAFSCSGLFREKMYPWEADFMLEGARINFIPPEVHAEGGDELDGMMTILVPVYAPEGVYTGTVLLTHAGGIEEYPVKFVIEIDPDLDIRDNAGNLVGNVMTLMGVRDGIAVGAFHLVNPNMFENNFDQFDGPANSHLFNGTASVTDLTFCAGGPDPKEPIPASDVDLMLGKDMLPSGEGTYGLVTINIPFYAKHWHQQYDFGYCGTVTVEYEDRLGLPASDDFDIYLMVLKSHGGMTAGFWGENIGNANVIHWGYLGIGEEGYALYRDGVKLADFVEEFEYSDPVATSNAYEYSLGVKVGGSEVMIGPITVGGHRPSVFSLGQNYPNPVSDHTSIRYTIAEASDVSIGVYNSAGMLVKNLVNEYRAPGVYTVNWDNVDMSNGVYFYRMNAGDFSMTQKMVVMK